MWYPETVTVAPASEPVTLTEVKQQCRIDDSASDTYLDRLIKAARAFVEAQCGTRLVTQTVAVKCDGFYDFRHLSFGPVASISSISYVDANGITQTLAAGVYEARIDGLNAAIVLKYGQVWPAIQIGSRITVTAIVGYPVIPEDIIQAMMLLIGAWFENREETVVGVQVFGLPASVAVNALLINHRLAA